MYSMSIILHLVNSKLYCTTIRLPIHWTVRIQYLFYSKCREEKNNDAGQWAAFIHSPTLISSKCFDIFSTLFFLLLVIGFSTVSLRMVSRSLLLVFPLLFWEKFSLALLLVSPLLFLRWFPTPCYYWFLLCYS